MTTWEIAVSQLTSTTPTKVPFLDELFNKDNSAVYYRYLYSLLSKKIGYNTLTIELGVYNARGTAHISYGNPHGMVVAIDPEPQSEAHENLRWCPNAKWIKGLSLDEEILSSFKDESVDVCFFDTLHEKDLVTAETKAWLPKIKKDGVLIFDDISLNDGMKDFWNGLQLEKLSVPALHWSGFGIARKA